MNHFAKICRKQKNAKPQISKKRAVITLDEESHQKDSVNFPRSTKLNESDYSTGEDDEVALVDNDIVKVKPPNMPIKIGKISTTPLVDSRSACSIANRSLLAHEVQSSPKCCLDS